MKRKFIDIRTSKDGELIDALCINKATPEQLGAVLALTEIGFEILIQINEEEVVLNN